MIEDKFHIDFATRTVRDWEKVAQQELGNKDPWQNLTKEKYGLSIKPYYDSSDAIKENKIALKSTVQSWDNVPKVIVADAKQANQEALAYLNAGADGIWFEVVANIKLDLLLRNIEMPYCSLFFNAKENSVSFLDELASYVEGKSMQEKINGVFFSESLRRDQQRFMNWNNFRLHGIHAHENKNIVDEIVDSLLMAVDRVDQLTNNKFSAEQAFRSIGFSISVGTDFFLSIAKIRALKSLWFTLQEAYQIKNRTAAFVHVDSPVWLNESFQPHGNLLKQTTAGMSAIIGGCNALTIEPEDFKNPMMSRIARNVSSILKEESHLSKVIDPLAGSFYTDSLTDQIAAKAWAKIKQTI